MTRTPGRFIRTHGDTSDTPARRDPRARMARPGGISSSVERQLPKLERRVRFPYPALRRAPGRSAAELVAQGGDLRAQHGDLGLEPREAVVLDRGARFRG